jgi:hypothetical protein
MQVASFMVVGGQVSNFWRQLFREDCRKCRGTGLVACTYCRGTATLRLTPARPSVLLGRFHTSSADVYECFHCGDETKHDNDLNLYEDDDAGTVRILDNIKHAMGNKIQKVHTHPPTTGTMRCTSCKGAKTIKLVAPNWSVLGLGAPWWKPIYDQRPVVRLGAADVGHRRRMMEYPSRPPRPLLADLGGRDAALGQAFKEEAKSSVSSSSAYRIEDYVLPYIEEDEE